MNIQADYDKLLECNLKDDLEWVTEEFGVLFRKKRKNNCYTKYDISLGNQILDNVIENIKTNESEELLSLLAITLNSIEKQFPEFF